MRREFDATKQATYMKYIEVAVLLAIGAWLLWGVAGVHLAKEFICPEPTDCAAYGQVGDIFGGINALFAALGFVGLAISIDSARRATEEERLRNRDRELLEQVLKSYEWAYHAFTLGAVQGRLSPDRLNWLIAARHLLRAERLADTISSETYRVIQQENEEHWRTQFYVVSNDVRLLHPDFYFEGGDRQRPVDFRSAVVIADFMSWRDDVPDPIDDIDAHEMLMGKGFKGSRLGRGIERFIVRNAPVFTEEHKKRLDERKAAKKED